jgi:hypothetical protein
MSGAGEEDVEPSTGTGIDATDVQSGRTSRSGAG